MWSATPDFSILIRRYDLQDVCKLCVLHDAECLRDHRLKDTRLKSIVRGKVRLAGVSLPQTLNVSRLKEKRLRKASEKAMGEITGFLLKNQFIT